MARADTARAGAGGRVLFKAAVAMFTALVAVIAVVLANEWLMRPQAFPVREVRFEGEFRHVTQAELAAAVGEVAHGNFLQLDLDAVKARAESLPWVYQAEVRRRWPRDLHIRFSEQQLVARWNEAAWVNQARRVVRVTGDDLPAELPQLAGPEGTQALAYEHYQEFSRLLAEAGLQIRKLTLTPRRTWRLELASGFTLVLDRTQPDRKLERFVRAYGRTLARSGSVIRQVDLRYTNGFAVEWHDDDSVAAAPGTGPEHGKTAAPTAAAREEG
jgi:cell division protein FtsQ